MLEEYTVQEGDTLFKLAEKFYGEGDRWTEIADANGGFKPEELQVGQELVIPGVGSRDIDLEDILVKEYVVEGGDTLFAIAEKLLGDGDRWQEIVSANGDLEPEELQEGQTLDIPGDETASREATRAVHKVQKGDELFELAERYLGDGNRWREISRANGNVDPKDLQIGQILIIPDKQGSSGGSGDGGLNRFARECLNAHNRYRKQVGVPPLRWSKNLESAAQKYARHLGNNVQGLVHSQNRNNQGENLAMSSGRSNPTAMIDLWGAERKFYNGGKMPNFSTTGNWAHVAHYTQIVWRNTTHVGCAAVTGRDGKYYFVGRYSPPGNFHGQSAF